MENKNLIESLRETADLFAGAYVAQALRAVAQRLADKDKESACPIVSDLLEPDLAKLKARLNGLRKLMGYVQDSSDVTVKLFQDDATRTFHIEVGSTSYYGDSFEEALDKAIAGDKS